MAEIKPTIIIERQEVSSTHPLQYKFITYKTVKDINGEDVQIVDMVEIKNTLELDIEIAKINKQIIDLQANVKEIEFKKAQIMEIS